MAEGRKSTWSSAERDVATFACRVLGRLELREAIRPLSEWLAVVWDRDLAIQAGLALCHTRRPEARPALLSANLRFGTQSLVWRRIAERIDRVPEPHGEAHGSAETLLARARERKAKGDHEGALEDYERVQRLDPGSPFAWGEGGHMLFLLGRLAEALAAADRAEALGGPHPTIHTLRSRIDSADGRSDDAFRELERALELNPEWTEALTARGMLRYGRGEFALALRDFELVTKVDPDDHVAHVNHAAALSGLGRLPDALAAAETAVRLAPRNADARSARGVLRQRLGDASGALDDFQAAVEAEPTNLEARLNLGSLTQDAGDHLAAIAHFDAALRLGPGDLNALRERAVSRRALGELDQAIADLDQVIERAPLDARGWWWRGFCRRDRGEHEAMFGDFGRVIELDSRPGGDADRLVRALLERAWAADRLGRVAEAAADYRRILELAPAHPRRPDIETWLRQHGG